MNKPATSEARAKHAALLPIWHLERDRALFIGQLGHNAPHAHSVPVFVAGLYQPLRLRIDHSPWQTCSNALIPAGVTYEFDAEGSPIAVIYLEPSDAGADALAPLVAQSREIAGVCVGSDRETKLLRELYERADAVLSAPDALADLVGFGKARARRGLDARVSRALRKLADGDTTHVSVAEAARAVGLSPSRFQHLVTAEIGVPFSRYRGWQRLRHAIREIVSGSNFTTAAHAAGFADQPHFARAFRKTFGAPASPSLRAVRQA